MAVAAFVLDGSGTEHAVPPPKACREKQNEVVCEFRMNSVMIFLAQKCLACARKCTKDCHRKSAPFSQRFPCLLRTRFSRHAEKHLQGAACARRVLSQCLSSDGRRGRPQLPQPKTPLQCAALHVCCKLCEGKRLLPTL
jgi:hypothetical protein